MQIELIYIDHFFEKLKEIKATKTIELSENLKKLFCLSPEKQEIIMVQKIIEVCRVFQQSR